jgi:hypothetical protein
VRRPAALLAASAALLAALMALWLAVSTRAAMSTADIEMLERRRYQLELENTEMERRIGELTAIPAFEQRMRAAGFDAPARVEYLVAAGAGVTGTPAISATAPGGAP